MHNVLWTKTENGEIIDSLLNNNIKNYKRHSHDRSSVINKIASDLIQDSLFKHRSESGIKQHIHYLLNELK